MALQISISNAIGARASGGVPAPSLLLDTYPNAAVAYSLRKLRTAYSGSAIRVRRSVDNAEQDIAFSGNDLDTTSMLDFVGYNLLTYSEDATQTAWIKLNGTVIADAITAPDSTTTADKFVENTINGNHTIKRSISGLVIGNEYNASMYIKKAERTKVVIRSNIAVGTNQTFDLDLTTGTVTNNQFSNTPVISNEGNDWWRVSIQMTCGSTSGANGFEVYLSNGTTTSYTGDGVSGVFVWGSQISQTSTVKTYQKTVATAGGNGFVTTWYDQSTNANNSTQATAANQSQVVLNGNLILDVDTSKITTTWTTDRYNLTNGISTNTKYFSISMFRRGATTTDVLIHLGVSSNIGGTNGQTPLIWTGTGTSYSVRNYMPTLLSFENVSTQGRCIMTSLKDATNLKVAYRNGVQLTTTATEAPSAGNNINVFGQAGGNYTSGQYQEYIYWDSEQSANRTGIEDNINTYWNVY